MKYNSCIMPCHTREIEIGATGKISIQIKFINSRDRLNYAVTKNRSIFSDSLYSHSSREQQIFLLNLLEKHSHKNPDSLLYTTQRLASEKIC